MANCARHAGLQVTTGEAMTLHDMRDKHDRLLAAVARNKREHKSTAVLLSKLQAIKVKIIRAEVREEQRGIASVACTSDSHAQLTTVAR